jgi:uncharacterized protein (TIGR03437 family)
MKRRGAVLVCAAFALAAPGAVLKARQNLGADNYTTIRSVAVDSKGFLYQTGSTSSPAFPVTPGSLSRFPGGTAVFVRKLNPATLEPVYSVLIGGTGVSVGTAIGVDSAGNAYVTGWTEDADFPATQRWGSGGPPKQWAADVFVLKLDAAGQSLVFSGMFGGSEADMGAGIALAPDGSAVVVGTTASADFPVTPEAIQPGLPKFSPVAGTRASGFVVRVKIDGTLDAATYLGGEGGAGATDVALDEAGDIYVAGSAGPSFPTLAGSFAPRAPNGGFAVKADRGMKGLIYSTYIPGVAVDSSAGDRVRIAVDRAHHAYFAAGAKPGFMTTPGAFQTEPSTSNHRDAFLMELDEAGRLVFATLFGNGNDSFAAGIALNGETIAIAGNSGSYIMPATDYSMPGCNLVSVRRIGQTRSAFVAAFDHVGRLQSSSGYGTCDDGGITDYAQAGTAGFVVGSRYTGIGTGFTAAIDLAATAPVQIKAAFNSANFRLGALAPLELVTIVGTGLGPRRGVAAGDGPAPFNLGGTRVLFNGVPAPILYASADQINVAVPVAGASALAMDVAVVTAEGTSAPLRTWMDQADFGLFTSDGSGVGQGAILNQDGTPNSAGNPAARGSVVSVFGTGFGLTDPMIADGEVATRAATLVMVRGIAASIGGVFGKVWYAGSAPSLLNGVAQLNVEIPKDAPVGERVPIMMHVYDEFTSIYYSQFGVTMAVR